MGAASHYVPSWTFRSGALSRMRAAGITRLRLLDAVTIPELRRAFPDQCQWIDRMVTAIKKRHHIETDSLHNIPLTVTGVLAGFNYSGPLEQITMETCFAADEGLTGYTPDFIQKNLIQLEACGVKYFKEHGLWPHVVVHLGLLKSDSILAAQ